MHQGEKAASGSFAQALAAFREARFADAAAQLKNLADSAPAVTLFARVMLRQGNPAGALALLTERGRVLRSRSVKGEAAMLKGVAFARLGDPSSASAQFKEADRALNDGDVLAAELIYQRAAAAWIERKLDLATKLCDKLPEITDADLDLHVRILRGAIASASENLAAQGAILLGALAHLRGSDEPTVFLYAMLVTQIAALAVELPSTELRDAATAHVGTVHWTPDIGDLHFHALRALAWRSALEGDEFTAFRRLNDALEVAQTEAWRVAAFADRAYLAQALGEKRWAAQELRNAHELSATIDWAAVEGEEKLALPVLAELFAERDPSVAIAYVATFKNLGHTYPRVASSRQDRRVEALEAYALGKVQMQLGEAAEARRLLLHAWTIYDHLGIRWRAARAALALAELGDGDAWRSRAEEALTPYPRSWLQAAAHPRAAMIAASPEVQNLTSAQRAVFDLIMAGRSTEQIAAELGRSTFTVRNHVKAILKAFGVRSRAALIVKASQL